MSSTRLEKKFFTALNAFRNGLNTPLLMLFHVVSNRFFRFSQASRICWESPENSDLTSENAARNTENTLVSIQFQTFDRVSRSHRNVDPIAPLSFSKDRKSVVEG